MGGAAAAAAATAVKDAAAPYSKPGAPYGDAIGLAALAQQVRHDLQRLAYPARPWVRPRAHASLAHVYDVLIVGGGQCGLAAAHGLMREQVTNVLVVDENPEGREGPWVTYARMMTLRTAKELTGPDLGVASLTFQAYYEAKYGRTAWEVLGKIPREEWMAYLVWYRDTLQLPVRNSVRVASIEPEDPAAPDSLLRVRLAPTEGQGGEEQAVLARKVVLATGIQGGGEWHVPSIVKDSVPKRLYAHTCEDVDFAALAGKRIAVLGGGASAFDNANYALSVGVAAAHVFVRRPELPRVNPIRYMENAGFLRHFADLDDATKYAGIAFFMGHNQPPTNDTFNRAARWPGFELHTGAPWQQLKVEGNQVRIITPRGDHGLYDFLVVSTGLLTDARLRPELADVAGGIATWADRFGPKTAPAGMARHALLDAHPYLGPSFEFLEKEPGAAPYLRSLFAYNYSALASLGLSASALSGMRYALPKLITGITRQLFLDDAPATVSEYLAYDTQEFVGQWPPAQPVAAPAEGAAHTPPQREVTAAAC